jgi:hypothetical protein
MATPEQTNHLREACKSLDLAFLCVESDPRECDRLTNLAMDHMKASGDDEPFGIASRYGTSNLVAGLSFILIQPGVLVRVIDITRAALAESVTSYEKSEP